MTSKQRVAIVDDNAPQRLILTRLLESRYAVLAFASGEEFIDRQPEIDCLLLDIEMPGANGYDTCRRFRAGDAEHAVPVLFVSAHDTAPERVAAYQAGGDDFITKPVAADELLHKVELAIGQNARLRELQDQSRAAQQIAFTAMSSMGDLGAIIDFMRQSAGADSYAALSGLLLDAMRGWGLRGAVQIRGHGGEFNCSSDELASPLQASVIGTLRDMGRIFELGSRIVINFTHVSLLAHNLPTDDPDKVGRLRDHLALLGEGADTRIAVLDAQAARDAERALTSASLAALRQAVDRSQANRLTLQRHTLDLLDSLGRSFEHLGLTEIQEGYVSDIVREGSDELRQHFDEAQSIENSFAEALAGFADLAASRR